MKTGYLTLSTHPEHPGLVRARIHDELPELTPQPDGSDIRYTARFRDVEAALMHVQNAMHGDLVDLEDRIYRQSLSRMIACVAADELDHERVWIDPALDDDTLTQIDALIDQRKHRQRRINRIWQIVGVLGLILLALTSLRG